MPIYIYQQQTNENKYWSNTISIKEKTKT